MIYYFDLRRTPLFDTMFEQSGVVKKNQFKTILHMYAMHGKHIRRLPSDVFYTRPEFEEGDDKIVCFDTYTSVRELEWLCETCPDKRVIFWFWNMVKSPEWFEKWAKKVPERVELWSFSLTDCRRYGLRHNTQFFFDCLVDVANASRLRAPAVPPRVLFIGRDKGRAETLYELGRQLKDAGAAVDLHITPDETGKFRVLQEQLIPYEQVIDLSKDADVLLDFNNDPESGLSMRCMEALFMGKKLITNNREILEADFYEPANIYVLGHDEESFEEFLQRPMVIIDSEIRDRYLLSNWLERFDGDGKLDDATNGGSASNESGGLA